MSPTITEEYSKYLSCPDSTNCTSNLSASDNVQNQNTVTMLIKQSYKDVETSAYGVKGTMRIIIIEPNVPEYPDAKFPGCVVFSEVRSIPLTLQKEKRTDDRTSIQIYQVSGPVERFAGQIASQGYICACPSSFHEFAGPEPFAYDNEGVLVDVRCPR